MPHWSGGDCSISDALFDQLEYLIDHKRESCPPTCPECARLNNVMAYLMAPFRPRRLFGINWKFASKPKTKRSNA